MLNDRSYLSRRLGPVFAEYAKQAAQPKTTSDRNLPAPVHRVVVPLSAAYKPTHGGYPTVGARA